MGRVRREWRVEADDAWLAAHRSTFFKRRRSKVLTAVADAGLPFTGPPRNPRLKLPDQGYSAVRYAQRAYAYTAIQIDLLECRVCGYRLLERHRMISWSREGQSTIIGNVQQCRRCQRTSWLFTSHMPAAVKGRKRDSKVVL